MTPSTTAVFHRDPRKTLPTAVGGEGMTLIDSDGKRYLDACGGAANSSATSVVKNDVCA